MVVGVILIHGAGELTIASFVMFWFRLNLSVTNIMEVHDMSSGKIIFRFKQGIVHFHVWREGNPSYFKLPVLRGEPLDFKTSDLNTWQEVFIWHSSRREVNSSKRQPRQARG